MRKGFTFIEVMIAVVIISIVIGALLSTYANNTYIFSSLDNKRKTNQYFSFIIDNADYGFENKKNLTLYDLLVDFDIENDLRRYLKSVKVGIIYQELEKIDMSEYELNQSENMQTYDLEQEKDLDSKMVFEIGKTILKTDDSSASILRIKLQ